MPSDFAFGKTGLGLESPEGLSYQTLEARSAFPIPNPADEIVRALDQPVPSPPVRDLAKNEKSAAIAVCDITRPVPNGYIWTPLFSRLESAGILREQVTILISTDLDRPATDREIREICGEHVAPNYHVVNHQAHELLEPRSLGNSSSGTPIFTDERFVSTDLHVTLGFTEPHLMLGYSGGRKLIALGLASHETTKVLHRPNS
jgi:lactate racemase